jgi:NADH dehydrogenase FAD-containing subunit
MAIPAVIIKDWFFNNSLFFILKVWIDKNISALIAKTDEELKARMTIVVVGGGPTGVELSGAIAEMRKYILPRDYPELDFSKMKIHLIEWYHKSGIVKKLWKTLAR